MNHAREPLCRRCRFPAVAIFYAVWPYFRVPPSLRMAEEMLAAQGIVDGKETIRRFAGKPGRAFSNGIARRAPVRGDRWHLDEGVVAIAGNKHWLRRTADRDGFSR